MTLWIAWNAIIIALCITFLALGFTEYTTTRDLVGGFVVGYAVAMASISIIEAWRGRRLGRPW